MPIRFSTQAANADHIGTDAEQGVPEGMSDDVGADGTPRDRSDRKRERGGAARDPQDKADAAKPGKDINAPFVKERDEP